MVPTNRFKVVSDPREEQWKFYPGLCEKPWPLLATVLHWTFDQLLILSTFLFRSVF